MNKRQKKKKRNETKKKEERETFGSREIRFPNLDWFEFPILGWLPNLNWLQYLELPILD